MRIGILGGSFNPIHTGHIELARFVLDNLPVMDEIWLMPCYGNLLEKSNIPFPQRFEMCKIACQGYNKIKASDYEYELRCQNTNELLTEFEKKYRGVITPYMIIGMDEAFQITNWVDWEDLISTNRFIVVDRIGFIPIKNKLWFQSSPHIYLKDTYKIIPEVSSTAIRERLAKNIPNEIYLKPSVFKYIKENKLYETIN